MSLAKGVLTDALNLNPRYDFASTWDASDLRYYVEDAIFQDYAPAEDGMFKKKRPRKKPLVALDLLPNDEYVDSMKIYAVRPTNNWRQRVVLKGDVNTHREEGKDGIWHSVISWTITMYNVFQKEDSSTQQKDWAYEKRYYNGPSLSSILETLKSEKQSLTKDGYLKKLIDDENFIILLKRKGIRVQTPSVFSSCVEAFEALPKIIKDVQATRLEPRNKWKKASIDFIDPAVTSNLDFVIYDRDYGYSITDISKDMERDACMHIGCEVTRTCSFLYVGSAKESKKKKKVDLSSDSVIVIRKFCDMHENRGDSDPDDMDSDYIKLE